MNKTKKDDRKTYVSWALYDWANSTFATTVMAGFFPAFSVHIGLKVQKPLQLHFT